MKSSIPEMPQGEDHAAKHLRRALLLGAGATLLYLLTAPAVPNPDGLGYLKLLPYNFAAGHLLYMPLLRATTRLLGDGLRAGRLLSALLCGSSVLLTYGITRRVLGRLPLGRPYTAEDVRFASTFAASGLGLSYGVWLEGADIEAYALALCALLMVVRILEAYRTRPTALRALGVGLFLGLAVLCHLTHVLLLFLCAGYLLRDTENRSRGLGHTALALGTGGTLSLGAYAYAALRVRGHDLAGAVRWVASAQHGFRYAGGAYRLGDAIYGLAKSVIYSPYLYEADGQKLVSQLLLGLLPLGALLFVVQSRWRALPRLPYALAGYWVVPYALLGVSFFGSDVERWLFILPALWILAASLVTLSTNRRLLVSVTLTYLFVVNFGTGIWPAHKDTTIRFRAEEVSRLLHDGDMVIFPGHSWDEYVTFYASAHVDPFPISYYAARDGIAAGFARLEQDARTVTARGGTLYAIRLFDSPEAAEVDPRGFAELAALGLSRPALAERLARDFSPTRVATIEDGADGLAIVRLDWRYDTPR